MAAWRRLAILLGLALAGSGLAAEPEGPAPARLITTVDAYWNIPEAARQRPHPIRIDLTILYYDSTWNLLWAQNGGRSVYLPVRGRAMPIQSGQRVRLEGTVVPALGLDGEQLKVTVLDSNAMPEPLPATGQMGDYNKLEAQWVEFEGYVFAQNETDASHMLYQMVVQNHLVFLRLLLSGTDPIPQLVGARVKARAVYIAKRDPAGSLQQLECWVPRRSDAQVLGWIDDDDRFKLDRTAIANLNKTAGKPWVHLAAAVQAHDPDKTLTLQDETGQIRIQTMQSEVLADHTEVEIVGRPMEHDGNWTLAEPLFREQRHPTPEAERGSGGRGQALLQLRLAEQVLQLPPEEAEKRYPVVLSGVVTWSDERAPFFYMQDASGGVCVHYGRDRGKALAVGSALIITGVTVRGPLVPEVELVKASAQGTMALPPARNITLGQALSGAEECRRVEIRGYVRQVIREGDWTRLDLTSATGEFTAYLPPDDSLLSLRGSLVRVRGVSATRKGASRELATVRLWVQDRTAVLIDEAEPADVFAAPALTVANFRQQPVAETINQRVRLTGQVLLHRPGRYLYLDDGSGGIFVLTRGTKPLNAGEWVELVGFPGRTGSRLVLREAVWRTVKPGPEIAPRLLPNAGVLAPEADARLVRFQAQLRQVATSAAGTRLTLQMGDTITEALLPRTEAWSPPEPGSRVEVTGVYVLEFDEYRQPHGFGLELRTPADIVLREAPPWWTVRRALYGLGGLAACILLVFGWVVSLRRRVRAQTEQIRRQLENEARLYAELERSSRLESLGVLAGGIAHDFNNLLTVILGNLGLAAMDKRVMAAAGDCIAEAERGTRRARDITQQLLTFAKGGDPIRSVVALPEIITEAANFARHGSNVRLAFDFPPDLPPADVDAGQISRVIHNLVINAVQAMPGGGMVSCALAAVTLGDHEVDQLPAGRYLRLTLADTGTGIPPEHLGRVFDPYFSTKTRNTGMGLAIVRSIVQKHLGHIEVESQVGQGTTFRLWLPAARTVPPAARAAPRQDASGPARILVMDDEEVIRRVAGRMLSLAGHEAAFAADGAEAVRAYFAAKSSGRPFDLVIFDLTVSGGMGGKDALQEILREDPAVRGVASSGYSTDPVMAHPEKFGFRCCLPKPYDMPDLLRAIGEARRN